MGEKGGDWVEELQEVFDYWKAMMGHERAQLGEKRKRAIQKALRMGYSVEDLQLAIVGCKVSGFHQGQNDRETVYDDIELVCRDEIHIDKFIRLGIQHLKRVEEKDKKRAELGAPGGVMSDSTRAKLDALREKFRTRVH